jgi:hypothetical protein
MFEDGTVLGWLESHSLLILGMIALAAFAWVSRHDKPEDSNDARQ